MMRQIYGNAWKTTICLGEAGDRPARIFQRLFDWALFGGEYPTFHKKLEGIIAKEPNAVVSMLEVPWWNRIWVLQEVVRSPWVLV